MHVKDHSIDGKSAISLIITPLKVVFLQMSLRSLFLLFYHFTMMYLGVDFLSFISLVTCSLLSHLGFDFFF